MKEDMVFSKEHAEFLTVTFALVGVMRKRQRVAPPTSKINQNNAPFH
jgi:hypothetical protein